MEGVPVFFLGKMRWALLFAFDVKERAIPPIEGMGGLVRIAARLYAFGKKALKVDAYLMKGRTHFEATACGTIA